MSFVIIPHLRDNLSIKYEILLMSTAIVCEKPEAKQAQRLLGTNQGAAWQKLIRFGNFAKYIKEYCPGSDVIEIQKSEEGRGGGGTSGRTQQASMRLHKSND